MSSKTRTTGCWPATRSRKRRQPAPAVPQHSLRHAIEVLLQFPSETRLPDAGDADHRDEVRLALLCARVEELLQEAKLSLSPDEGWLERLRLETSTPPGRHTQRLP